MAYLIAINLLHFEVIQKEFSLCASSFPSYLGNTCTCFIVETVYMNFKSRWLSLSSTQGLGREIYSIEWSTKRDASGNESRGNILVVHSVEGWGFEISEANVKRKLHYFLRKDPSIGFKPIYAFFLHPCGIKFTSVAPGCQVKLFRCYLDHQRTGFFLILFEIAYFIYALILYPIYEDHELT